jgi:hypothetical protein
MKAARALRNYLSQLSAGKTVLWCYLIWYVVTVTRYFDPSPAIWLNSLGISAVIGFALMLSFGRGRRSDGRPDGWQTMRLFLMPFCVSSFSTLIKGQGFILIAPPRMSEVWLLAGCCLAFVLVVLALKRLGRRDGEPRPSRGQAVAERGDRPAAAEHPDS